MYNKKELHTMTAEKMQEIYTNERLRNAVATAHTCKYQDGKIKYKKALYFPQEFKVTDEQIQEAQNEIKAAKKRLYEAHSNDLILVGMGMLLEADYPTEKNTYKLKDGEINNHRARATFKNADGRNFLLCVIKSTTGGMVISASVDLDVEEKFRNGLIPKDISYNYMRLENEHFVQYTEKAFLKIVNTRFNCNFKRVILSNYTANTNDKFVLCESPALEPKNSQK